MKKITFLTVLILISSIIMVGCNFKLGFNNEEIKDSICDHVSDDTLGNDSESYGDNNTVTEAPVLPTLDELIALNSYGEILKVHDNVYIKNTFTSTNPQDSYVEDAVLFNGDGKIDYHMRETMTIDNTIAQDLSRVGNEWYYCSIFEPLYAILELGEMYTMDYTIPELYDCVPIGKAYIDGEYIVQHAYIIHEAQEEYNANRNDYTYYFNKETKFIEKIVATSYDHQHNKIGDYVIEICCDVNIDDIFHTTAMDNVYGSDNRIDIEIIAGYNTAEQITHSLVATTNSIVMATINGNTYLMYTDPACENQVMHLGEFEGQKTLTLYAKELVFEEEVRYTVTEEEWNAVIGHENYTVEIFMGDLYMYHKYTENALQMEDDIIIFIDDRQYLLEETSDGYVANDCTSMDFEQGKLLEGAYYNDFVYDEELCAYVCDAMEEIGKRWEIRFENGLPVSLKIIEVKIVDDVENTNITECFYTNVGTTFIEIPEYVFAEESENNTRRTVTEDEWELNTSAVNFVADFYTIHNYEYTLYSFKSTEDAVELNGDIIVFEGGKIYILEEIEGVLYATAWTEFEIARSLLPYGLTFEDFEYSEQQGVYVQKVDNGSGWFYSVGFEEGVLKYVMAQKSLDPEDPGYFEVSGFDVYEIGTAVIEVPEYVITE